MDIELKSKKFSQLETAGTLIERLSKITTALDVVDLSNLLGIGKSAIYNMAKANRIPHIRIGSIVRFDPARIAAWLKQREFTGTVQAVPNV